MDKVNTKSNFVNIDPEILSGSGDFNINEEKDIKSISNEEKEVNEDKTNFYYIIEDPEISDEELEMIISTPSNNEISQTLEKDNSYVDQITVEDTFSEMCILNPSDYKVISHIHVVLDCANIGWSYADRKRFYATGVSKAICYFQSKGDSN
jgi:hypothetical protein